MTLETLDVLKRDMSDYVDTEKFRKDFRSFVAHVVLQELGAERFGQLCYVLSVPEGVREKNRAEILFYLRNRGQISPDRPEEFVNLLRNDLQREDLAAKAEKLIGTPNSATVFLIMCHHR